MQQGEDGGEWQETVRVRRLHGLPSTWYLALNHSCDIIAAVVGLSLVLMVTVRFSLDHHCCLDETAACGGEC